MGRGGLESAGTERGQLDGVRNDSTSPTDDDLDHLDPIDHLDHLDHL